MKKFLLKTSLVLSAFLILLILNDLTLKWDYEPSAKAKSKYDKIDFESCSTSSRAFFLGSSLTNCQINPLIFDSITGLCSYNLGLNGLMGPQKINLLKSLVEDSIINSGDILFMEYQMYLPVAKLDINKKLNTSFHRYFYTTSSLLSELKYLSQTQDNKLEYLKNIWEILKFYINSRTKIHNWGNTFPTNQEIVFLEKNLQLPRGFYPYKGKRKEKYKDLGHRVFQDKIDILYNEKIQTFKNSRLNPKELPSSYKDFYNYCEVENIKLYYVIPSTHGSRLKEMQFVPSLIRSFPDRTISFYNDQNYSHLFQSKYFYDVNHYNLEGAKLYSQAIAEKYLDLL